MSVTVGGLTIFYTDFALVLSPNLVSGGTDCEGLALFSVGPQGPIEHGSLFQMSDCGSAKTLADDSLGTFAASDLSAFHSVTVESIVNSPHEIPLGSGSTELVPDWNISAKSYAVERVPEPDALVLLALSFAGIGAFALGRRKLSFGIVTRARSTANITF